MPMIDFGASSGSTEAGAYIRPFVRELFEIFHENKIENNYFRTLEKFHIVFLVSGKNQDYGSEGAEGLRKVRGKNILLIYNTIPEHRWKNINERNFKDYLARGIRSCFDALCKKAKKMDEINDEDTIRLEFDECLRQFQKGS